MMSTEQKEESAQFKELTKSIVGIALIYDVRKMWKRVKKWSLCPLQAPPTLIAHHKRSNGLNWIGPVKITGSTVTQHPDFTFRSNTKPSALSLSGNRFLAKAIIKKEKKRYYINSILGNYVINRIDVMIIGLLTVNAFHGQSDELGLREIKSIKH